MRYGAAWRELAEAPGLGQFALLCLGAWLHAADTLVTATIVPAAVEDIGGIAYVSWTISLYQIGSIVAGATVGLLAQLYGLRRVLLGAAILYGIGCVGGALAPDMAVLLAARLIQGAGGGLMVALSYVAIQQQFPEPLWGRLMAIVATIWCAGSLLGPLIGGLFADAGLWRGAFWSFAAQAALLFGASLAFLHPSRSGRESRGSFTLWPLALLAVATLMIAQAGASGRTTISIVLGIAGLALLYGAARLDRKASTRLLPGQLLDARHPVGSGLLMVFALSASTTGFWAYGPLILKIVFGIDPLIAGYILAGESVAWGVATLAVAGTRETAARRLIRSGAGLVVAGAAGFIVVVPAGSLAGMVVCGLLQGAGFGLCWPSIVHRIVIHAAPAERGLAASAAATMQRIGYAVGAAATGIAANAAGLADGMTIAAASIAAFWVFAAFVPLLIVGVAAAYSFTARRPVAAAL
jgi:MFS family permease